MKNVLVVGAGFSGAVIARVLHDAGWPVTVIDKRSHIGGNAYDELDEHGVLVHRYGPHIFHTNAERIVDWLSRFTEWRHYEHRVRAAVGANRTVPFPINRDTLNEVFGTDLATDSETAEFLDDIREPKSKVTNVEEHVLNSVGPRLYALFFQGYTTKQWGRDPREIKAGVAARIPVRNNTDDRYFTDRYQLMPAEGYTKMFTRILEGIPVELGVEYDHAMQWAYDLVVYTGAIDEYFNYELGTLPYRSLRFSFVHHAEDSVLPTGTVNYPGLEVPFTRITEFKKLTGQEVAGSTTATEFPQSEGERYYPVLTEDSEALYRRYRELAKTERGVLFCGRLGSFKYYDMHQVVAEALGIADDILGGAA